MSGIIYPDFANSIGSALQLRQGMQRNALAERQLEQQEQFANEDRALRRETFDFNKLKALDEQKRTQLKEAAAWTSQAAMGVLSAPPEQRPQAYAAALADGKARGFDLSSMPPVYSPAVDGQLQFHLGRARDVDKYFADQDARPAPMGTGAPPSAAPGGPPAGGDDLTRSGKAIAGIESSGKYDAMGPVTNGDRAYGKYQIMGANIGPWTQEALGKPMTPQEFIANPQAQEATFKHKFGQYLQKYGPEGAARAWFAGETGMNNPNAKDVLGTSVAGYADKFNKGFGAPSSPQVASAGGIPQGGDPGMVAPGMPSPQQEAQAAVRGLQLPPGAQVVGVKGIPITKDGTVLVRMPDGTPNFIPLPQRAAPKEQGAGPLAGNGLDAQLMNILLTGDPATQQYAAAYAHLSAPRTTIDPQSGQPITIQPNIGWARPPAFANGGQPTGTPTPPQGTQSVQLPGGGTATMSPGLQRGPTQKELSDLKTAKSEANTIISALEDFRKEFKGAGFMDRAKSVTGMTTPLNTSYNVAALLAKGEALFNLGVLNGPDLDIIRRTLPDPSTLKGTATSAEDMGVAVDKVIQLLNTRVSEKEKQLGISGNASKPQTYMGPDNRPISFREIEDTAKNRGISTDEVIQKLGLKPAGGQ